MATPKVSFSLIVQDNEEAVRDALDQKNYVQAFVLTHALVESLLRHFLDRQDDRLGFHDLVGLYEKYLRQQSYPFPTFIKELKAFNQRRNRVIHQLWKHGYTHTNCRLKDAASAAVIMYGLFIEWLETFDSDITKIGYHYD
jgi:hypothetical protein